MWEFVVKSWANGTEHRRVYVLEHAAEFIACKRLREGDVVGICADAHGALVIEVRAPSCAETPCRSVPLNSLSMDHIALRFHLLCG